VVYDDVSIEGWEHWAELPPMAQLANCLTNLTLVGAVR